MIIYIGGFKVCSLKFVRTCKLMVGFVLLFIRRMGVVEEARELTV